MSKLQDRLATNRVAYWFAGSNDLVGYYRHLARAWRAVAEAVPWDALAPHEWAMVPVYTGRILDRALARERFGHDVVEGVIFGLPGRGVPSRVEHALRNIGLPGTLGVSVVSPRPDSDGYSFPLTEILTYRTVVLLTDGVDGVQRGFDADIGLQLVRPRDEDEEHWLEMVAGDLDLLAPHLIRLFGRNLPTWINEPARGSSPVTVARHAVELLASNAPGSAITAAGRAIECHLRDGWRAGGKTGNPPPLAHLIDAALQAGTLSATEAEQMHGVRKARNLCAHATLREEDPDAEVERTIPRLVRWTYAYLQRV